jgi:hypothetical protein
MSAWDAGLSDPEIRGLLRKRLRAAHTRDASTVFLEELGLCRGQGRVDLAVVNGHLHGYEIKSDRDGLRRLPGQIHLYGSVLDRATLVVGGRHLGHAMGLLPQWWGVLRVERGRRVPRLVTVRRGRNNPGRDPRALAELLWLDDAIQLLAEHGAARGVRGKSRPVVWDRLRERISTEDIAAAVRARLKARATQQSLQPPS